MAGVCFCWLLCWRLRYAFFGGSRVAGREPMLALRSAGWLLAGSLHSGDLPLQEGEISGGVWPLL